MRALALLLALTSACERPSHLEHVRKDAKTMDLELVWKITPEKGALRIDYTVTNHTSRQIYLLDRLLYGNEVAPEAVVVRNSGTPGVVAFTRALVQVQRDVLAIPLPEARPLAPGASASGVGRVKLPLRAWANYGPLEPLAGTPTRAVLEIGWIPDPGPAGFTELRTDSGAKILYPEATSLARHQLLRSEPEPLPVTPSH